MPSRAARFAAVYAALMAAHDVADHIVQTDHQAASKARSWRAMAGHIGSYHAVQLVVLAAVRRLDVRPAWWRVLLAVTWSAGTHAFLDRRWPVRALLELTGSPTFAIAPGSELATHRVVYGSGLPHIAIPGQQLGVHGPYLADQACHHACLLVAAAVLAGGAR